MSDRAELRRMLLRLERDLTLREQLRVLLAASNATITGRRGDIRNLKARIERGSPRRRRTT